MTSERVRPGYSFGSLHLSFSGQIIPALLIKVSSVPGRYESQTFLTLGENLSSVSFSKGKSGETNTLRVEGLYIVGLLKA